MRGVFEYLAKEELEHKAKLELEAMKTGQTVTVTPEAKIPKYGYDILDKRLRFDMEYKDMLLLGMKKEEASFRIYVDLIRQVAERLATLLTDHLAALNADLLGTDGLRLAAIGTSETELTVVEV